MRRFLALALLLAGCRPPAAPPALQAGPEPAARPAPALKLDFAAYGDCRSGHETHRRICASLVRSGAKFVVVSGDLVDWGDDADDWRIFREITRELRAKADYLPAPGNHDGSRERTFEREFGLTRTWYDRKIGDVHLFCLDSNAEFADQEQLDWLEATAAASTARHKIAAFHHSAYSLDGYGEFEEKPVRERLHPLLLKHKFCAAFAGHHHSFYTTVRNGLRYVVTAGGGAHLYRQTESRAIRGDLYRSFHHFVGLTFTTPGIAARVFDPDGVEVPELAFDLCTH